jgi:hypothetical protein
MDMWFAVPVGRVLSQSLVFGELAELSCSLRFTEAACRMQTSWAA